MRFFIICWQCWLEMMALDLCHVVVDGVVFIAPLYLDVNAVLYSLSDLIDFISCYRVVVSCLYDLLLKCVCLDFLCWSWLM